MVPELKSITIGGALAGIGIESSSFRYGLVHETIPQFETVLADGRVLDCNPNNQYSDLYHAFPNSYGTLGYALKIRVTLIPVKKYIKLTYHHFSDPIEFFSQLNNTCLNNKTSQQIAYIDGVIFEKNHLVMIAAEFVDEAPFLSNYKYMSVYYQSIKVKQTDYLTTEDYIWRWDTDWFWCSRIFHMENPVLRFLLGKWMLKSTAYSKLMHFTQKNRLLRWWLNRTQKPTESVIQDVAIPIENAAEYFTFFQDKIGIKPIWVCPASPLNTHSPFQLFPMQPSPSGKRACIACHF